MGARDLPRSEYATESVVADVRQGRWLVLCPNPTCDGIELANEHEGFFCCECRNALVGHRPMRIVFPTERSTIEEILLERELPVIRDWLPGETVEQLRAENAAKGPVI